MTTDISPVAQVIGPIYGQLKAGDRPIFIAFIERFVGGRYRQWASEANSDDHRQKLIASADREDQNADVLESRDPNANARLERLIESFPEMETLLSNALSGLSRSHQMKTLAGAERAGDSLYRQFAGEASDSKDRDSLLECAEREQANAAVLEELAESA